MYIICICRICKCVFYKFMYFLYVNDLVYIMIFVIYYFDMFQNYLYFCLNWKIKLFVKQILVNIDIFI